MVCSAEPVEVTEKRRVGRPSVRTPEAAEAICNRLALGESLVSICSDESLPCYATVLNWLNDEPEFVVKYARARVLQAQSNEFRAVDICLNAKPETAQVARLQFDALKWQAAKCDPKKYGDKDHGDIHVTTAVNNILVMPETRRAEIMERRKALLP